MEIIDTTIAVSVNHQYRVIFVHIPKNAGTSIRNVYFPKYSYRLDLKRSKKETDDQVNKYKELGYKTFTVWRTDVVDRFMTAYLEDIKRVDVEKGSWWRNMKWYKVKDPRERFFTYLSEAEEYKGFSHCIRQIDAVRDSSGSIREFDYNFTMDTVNNVSKALFNGAVLPRKMSNQGKKKSLDPYIDRYVVRRLRKLYLDDIKHISDLAKKGLLWKN